MTDSEDRKDDAVKNWFNAVFRGVGTVVVAYILALFTLYALRDTFLFGSESPSTIVKISGLVAEFMVVGTSVLIVSYLTKVNEYIDVKKPSKTALKLVVFSTILMLLIQVLSSAFTGILGIESASNTVVEQGESNPIYYLYLVPVMLLFVGPVEEYVFRGVIQSTFAEFVNYKVGIAVASTLFGLIHLSAVGGATLESIPYIVTAAILGVVLGYYYEKTGNIVVPMLAHGIYNSVLMLILFASFQLG